MAQYKLWDLPPYQGNPTRWDDMADYVGDIADMSFPDAPDLARNARVTAYKVFDAEHYSTDSQLTNVPEELGNDQIEDWLIGSIVKGALDMNRQLEETTFTPGTRQQSVQEPLF